MGRLTLRSTTTRLTVLAILTPGLAAQFALEPPVQVALLDGPASHVVADVTGDGRTDVVVMERFNSLNNRITTLVNGGDGTLTPLPGGPLNDSYLLNATADIDGDGTLDVLFGFLSGSAPSLVSLNPGTGQFATPTHLMPGLPGLDDTDEGEVVAAGDLDGDGDVDVVMAQDGDDGTGTPLQAKWLRNDGPAGFALGQRLLHGLPDASVGELQLGDLDLDGALDVLLASRHEDRVGVWDDDGSGTWVARADVQLPASNGLALVDMDGDGQLDLVGAGASMLHTSLGQGDGTFALPLMTPADTGISGLRVAELDGDGAPDLITFQAGAFLTGGFDLWHGVGDGRFDGAAHINQAFLQGLGVAADVDDDGLADVITSSGDVVRLHRQRDYAGTPWTDLGGAAKGVTFWPWMLAAGSLLPGEPVLFDLYEIQGPTFLVLGLGELGLPFKGGTLHPSPDFVMGPLPANAGPGHLRIEDTWPNGAGGFSFAVQGWTPDPPGSGAFSATGAVRANVP